MDHPFHVDGKGWTAVEDMGPGDRLITADGAPMLVKSIEAEGYTATTYNLTVANAHTFFVGDERIWVHNVGPCNLPNATERGRVRIEDGASPDANEIRAAEGLADKGFDVEHRKPQGDEVPGKRTPDLTIGELGDVDVFTPDAVNPTSITRAIEKKKTQANGVLVLADLTEDQMQEIAARLFGRPRSENIERILFQRPNGDIVIFERPS